jgi:hypothetical protein
MRVEQIIQLVYVVTIVGHRWMKVCGTFEKAKAEANRMNESCGAPQPELDWIEQGGLKSGEWRAFSPSNQAVIIVKVSVTKWDELPREAQVLLEGLPEDYPTEMDSREAVIAELAKLGYDCKVDMDGEIHEVEYLFEMVRPYSAV